MITACQEVSACQYVCFKFFDTLIDLINDLQSFIIIFSKSHSHQIENYQSETAYYIDRRYCNQYEKRPQSRSQQRYSNRSSNDSDQSYDRKNNNFDRNRTMISYNAEKKRCFICNKIDCWSINHIWKKRNASKTRLKKRFNESFNRSDHQSEKDWKKRIFQYIIEYVIDHEGIDSEIELVDEMKTFTMKIDVSKVQVVINQSKVQVVINQQLFYEINWRSAWA